jgi:hypothetical protein
MNPARLALLGAAFLAIAAPTAGSLPAEAGGNCVGFTLTCENGRNYSFCPLAVSDEGDIVSAYLTLSPRLGTHVRLVPMGVGYRYIGPGVWLDGLNGEAILNFGKSRSVSCAVVHD